MPDPGPMAVRGHRATAVKDDAGWPLVGESRRVVVRQLATFTAIGVVMTLAYLTLFAALRLSLGTQEANAVAWVVTAVADTSANRRFTFGLLGRDGAVRAQAESLVIFGLGVAIASGSLVALAAGVAQPARWLELAVLAAANIAAGLLRFGLLRAWVFAPERQPNL